MASLDATVVNVAQRTFVDEFSSTQAIVAWTMISYALSFAVAIPLTGWAANRFGTKRLALSSVLLFTVGSLLCALAPNIELLVAFRALQGLGGGILLPLPLIILAHEAGPKQFGRALTISSIPMLIAPIGGPVLGGWLIDSFGWPWIFLVNLPVGLLTLVLAARILPKNEPIPAGPLDVVGMFLLSPGLALVLYGMSLLPGRGTIIDPHVYVPVAIGLNLIFVFVVHALWRTDHPLIDLRLLENRAVASANATRFLFGVVFFGSCLLFPAYFQQVLGKTSSQAGLLLVPQTVAAAAAMPAVGRLMEKHGPRSVVLTGIALSITGMGMFTYAISQYRIHIPLLLFSLAVFGVSCACLMTPVSYTAVHTLESSEVAHGSTLFNVTRNTAAAVGAALMSVILTSTFNSSASIAAAGYNAPLDLSLPPPKGFTPDLMEHTSIDLSRSYVLAFMVAMMLAMLTLVPALFLPNRPARNPAR
jgi:EmrB/QacA subfamily drug resistance transporter